MKPLQTKKNTLKESIFNAQVDVGIAIVDSQKISAEMILHSLLIDKMLIDKSIEILKSAIITNNIDI